MERKNTLKQALELCKLGKFKEGLNILHNSPEEITNKWITYFLVNCCSACVSNSSTPGNISETDLYDFLTHIVSYIKNINDSEVLSYLQSIFHILKFFVQTKCYQLIAHMDPILLPSFLPPSLPAKHNYTFESSASLLHNFIIKEGQKEHEPLLKICSIVSRIYARTSNVTTLLTTSLNCTITLSGLSCPMKHLETNYFDVLSLIKLHKLEVNSEADFKNFASLFSIIYLLFLKESKFENAAQFHEDTIKSCSGFFNDGCIRALTLLKFPLILTPFNFKGKTESLMECNKNLWNLDSAKRQIVGQKLNSILSSVIFSCYKSLNGTEWNKFSQSFRLDLLQFIWDISRIELLAKYNCPCECLIEKNVYIAFTYCQFISKLLEVNTRQKNNSNDFHKKSADLLARFSEDIKTLKEYNCEKWRKTWEVLGMALYSIGAHLHKNSDKGYLHYFHNMIKCFIKFEANETEQVLKPSIVSSVFTVLCDVKIDHKKYMALCALAVKLCSHQKEAFVINWIKAKVRLRDGNTPEGNDLQKLTLVLTLKKFKKEIEFLTCGANLLTTADKINLLVLELEQYKLRWKSKIPMMCALKELYQLADLTKFVEVMVTIFGDCELMLHDEIPKMLQDTLEIYEKQMPDQKATVYLAFLYYMHYKYCVKDVVSKNISDIEQTMNVNDNNNEPPDAIPKDPNEKCDIISFYDSLNMSKYISVMKYLNKSLDLFASVIKDTFNVNDFAKVSYTMLYSMLMKISFEYRIHRYAVKSLQALQLALTVAKSEQNSSDIIWTVSFIIENADLSKTHVKNLSNMVDKLLFTIDYTDIQNLKVVLTYYICKSKSILYDDYKEAYRIFQMAKGLYDEQKDKPELKLVKSQLYLLYYRFVLMPCNLNVMDHKKETLLTIHVANSTIYEVYNTSKLDGPYEMSLLLSTTEELAKLHHFLQCPREVRAYCKEIILLAQRLVLPLQCAYYLVYLSHADLRSSRYDDCEVKNRGLADILCLTRPHYNIHVDQENKPPLLCADIESDIAGITNEMEEMVLDLPAPKMYKKQFSPSSPTLIVPSFHPPAFLHHENECDCFCCTSFEYQRLVLEKIRLDALLNVKQNNDMISADFFHGALRVYEQCSRRFEAYVKTATKMIPKDLVPDLREELLEVYGYTLLNYSSYLMRTNSKTDALKVTNKLIDLISTKKVAYIYLYNEALFQKLGYLMEIPSKPSEVNKAPEMDSLCPAVNVVSKTPESKQSKVTFSIQYSPHYSPPKRRVKKCLPFNLSPTPEDNSNNNKPKEKSIVPTEPKTPAPKIKIYSQSDTEPKTKNTARKLREKKKTEDAASIVSNGVLNTPVAVKPAETEELRTKTRLLTNRLRQSSKKPEASEEVGKDNDKIEVTKVKMPSLRKNLFEQGKVDTGEAATRNGAIRRTTRNRKV